MEELTMMPTSAGQICKVINPMDDENPEDVYVLTEDPTPFEAEDSLYFVNIKDLQRNINNPTFSPQVAFPKAEVVVVANDLESYIASWNK
jgi:hypothetical protein